MDTTQVRALLAAVGAGETSPDEALERLRLLPFEQLGFASIDHHRALRRGFPEVIFGQGKTPAQVAAIAARLRDQESVVLCTRADRATFDAVRAVAPEAVFHDVARMITIQPRPTARANIVGDTIAGIAVVTAGTSDIPVAEEAAVTAEAMGHAVDRINDVGVAGLHRLLAQHERLLRARVVVVVAGMEGALPSVVAGLIDAPVIAVPTSVGYGANFGGVAALLGMLKNCAGGVAVVNIDNGFGAGMIAAMIDRRR